MQIGVITYRAVLRIRIWDPESGAFLPQGSGVRDDFFRIPDLVSLPRPNSIYLQDYGEKQEKLNFV
jgi:hypothetical protein